jgi:hypothetical protein
MRPLERIYKPTEVCEISGLPKSECTAPNHQPLATIKPRCSCREGLPCVAHRIYIPELHAPGCSCPNPKGEGKPIPCAEN